MEVRAGNPAFRGPRLSRYLALSRAHLAHVERPLYPFPRALPAPVGPLSDHLSIGAQYLVGNPEEGLGFAGHVFEVELDCLALSAHAHRELAVLLVVGAELTLHLLRYNYN